MRLAGKTAIITGGGAGIGRGCAQSYAQEGASIAIIDRQAEAAAATAQAIARAGGEAHAFCADVADPDGLKTAMDLAVARLGRVDILISNAGIGGRRLGDGPVHQCTVEAWETILRINLGGAFLACKYALPYMMDQGGGSIITLSSVLGLVGTQGLFDTHAYAASKAGIIGLTRAIAAHYAHQGIRANVIAPGLIDTQMATRAKSDPALLDQVGSWQPLGPLGQIEDVAAAAVFFGSDESRFITGVVLPVDGGWTVQ